MNEKYADIINDMMDKCFEISQESDEYKFMKLLEDINFITYTIAMDYEKEGADEHIIN